MGGKNTERDIKIPHIHPIQHLKRKKIKTRTRGSLKICKNRGKTRK